jgi:hypothetical protein
MLAKGTPSRARIAHELDGGPSQMLETAPKLQPSYMARAIIPEVLLPTWRLRWPLADACSWR